MYVSPEDVEHVAQLARLRLEQAERDRMAAQLDRILAHAEQLQELDTHGVEPLAHVLPDAVTPLRPDRAGEPLAQEQALANAPDRHRAYFKVPRMIEARDHG